MTYGPDGKRKYPASEWFRFLPEFAVNFAAVVLVKEDARPVGPFVEHPTATDLDVRRNFELVLPTLLVDALALFFKEVTDKRAATIATRMARPPLLGQVGHNHR